MGLSPHEILFGYNPPSLLHSPHSTHARTNGSRQLQHGAVQETSKTKRTDGGTVPIVDSACCQQKNYHSGEPATLIAGQEILVDNPTHGKLDPRWLGL